MSDFATALTHQSQYREIGAGIASHHAQERAFANPAAAKDSNPLSAPAGQEAIYRANPTPDRFPDQVALQGQGCGSVQ